MVYIVSCAQNSFIKLWDARFGGVGLERLDVLQPTSDGGFLLSGSSTSGISGDKTQDNWDTNYVHSDYWIVKIDFEGHLLWDKRFGGLKDDILHAAQETSDKGFILGGSSDSDLNGDKTDYSRGSGDYWIVKTDSLGNIIWDKTFGGSNGDILTSLQQTFDGGYILGGWSLSDSCDDKSQYNWSSYADFWVVKTDSNGIKQWDKRFGGTYIDGLYSIRETPDSGFILGGISLSGISGDVTQPNRDSINQTEDYWIIKIDSIGNYQWDKLYGGNSIEYFSMIQPCKHGGYIISGSSFSGISGDKSEPNNDSLNSTADFWILKIDSLGGIVWEKTIGGSDYDINSIPDGNAGSIFETLDGGYIISGASSSPISGDKSETNLGGAQSWLVKIDSMGNKEWDKTIFSNSSDFCGYVAPSSEGCFAIANWTEAGIGGYKSQSNWGDKDFWILKFCDSTHIGTDDLQSTYFQNIIYPNPAKTFFTISSIFPFKSTFINIHNILGEKIFSAVYGSEPLTVNCEHFPPGIYFISLRTDQGIIVQKLIKQ